MKNDTGEIMSENNGSGKYESSPFGSLKWLSCQAGYCKIRKIAEADPDVKLALKDLLIGDRSDHLLYLEIYRDLIELDFKKMCREQMPRNLIDQQEAMDEFNRYLGIRETLKSTLE